MRSWQIKGGRIFGAGRPAILGILNATPDSFSDGDPHAGPPALLARARQLAEDGADLIDLGGESTRPGSHPVTTEVELARVRPTLELIAERIAVPVSIDTRKPEVARAAIAAGAAVINDVGGLRDPAMIEVVAGSDVGVVVMHMQGEPATMQDAPTYGDVVVEVCAWLADRVEAAVAAGIARERIAVDPGIGFGKSFAHNIALLRNLASLAELGCPILVGTSRKGFLGAITGRPIADRRAASVASAIAAAQAGASIVRVHDVAALLDALKVWEAQVGWEPTPDRSTQDHRHHPQGPAAPSAKTGQGPS